MTNGTKKGMRSDENKEEEGIEIPPKVNIERSGGDSKQGQPEVLNKEAEKTSNKDYRT